MIGGARRGACPECLHEQRIDIEPFDYGSFAMGGTGLAERRLQDQADFIARFLPPGASVLELGCAAGQLAAVLKSRIKLTAYNGIELRGGWPNSNTVLSGISA